MRRDSWRSVPQMNSPPAAITRSRLSSTFCSSSGSDRLKAPLVTPPSSTGSTPSRASCWRARCSGLPPSLMSTPRPAMFVAIVTAPGWPASATMSASRAACSGLAFRTVCGMPRLVRRSAEQLGDLDRDRSDEHRLAGLVARRDLAHDRAPLALLGLVDLIVAVVADHRHGSSGSAPPAARRSSGTRWPP